MPGEHSGKQQACRTLFVPPGLSPAASEARRDKMRRAGLPAELWDAMMMYRSRQAGAIYLFR